MAKHSKGKHTQSNAEALSANQDASEEFKASEYPTSSPAHALHVPKPPLTLSSKIGGAAHGRVNIAKRVGFGFLIAAAAAVVIYLAGVLLFSNVLMPNTFISTYDASFKTPSAVRADFEERVSDYTVRVKGNMLNEVISSSDAGIAIDSQAMTEVVFASQNPWAWPVEVFQPRDMAQAMTDSISATRLSEIVQAAVDKVNADAKAPIDARVEFSPESGSFEIIDEVPGTMLDYELVLANIVASAMALKDTIIITDSSLIAPTVFSEDPRLATQQRQANDLIKANFTLMLGEFEAAKVGSGEIKDWVALQPDFTAVINEPAMNEWANNIAKSFNTVGSTRTFTRPDGATITVSGGDYGWSIDSSRFVTSLVDSIKTGFVGNLEVPYVQSGVAYNGIGAKDWGNRYIDVDISEQYARFYDADGKIIWESAVVTGTPTPERATPKGVFDLNSKGTNVTLTGRDKETGEITYESEVSYWMPFKGNSVGFHDATWQSGFGGNRYRNGSGSHGCVNLPFSKAQSLYSLIRTGDVVVVHD